MLRAALCTGGSRIRLLFVNFTLPRDSMPFIVHAAKITVSYFVCFFCWKDMAFSSMFTPAEKIWVLFHCRPSIIA